MKMKHGVLGEKTDYPKTYDRTILCAIDRSLGREQIDVTTETLLTCGADIWHGYELSWLASNGVPQVGIVRIYIPATSPYIIESKSLKLYLNSINFSHFDNSQSLINTLQKDLSECVKDIVKVEILPLTAQSLPINHIDAVCIDESLLGEVYHEIDHVDKGLLMADKSISDQYYYSNLLRSNCPVTNQPDWGTIVIKMTGQTLNQAQLLRYILSYRNHNGFHEQCVEQIFSDLLHFKPSSLCIQAFYTRRGGLDINPIRMFNSQPLDIFRLVRQ